MTAQEFLALPDDGTERWLIRGQLRERPMTVRNRVHSQIMVLVSAALLAWSRTRPEPRGVVICGEAGVRLRQTADSVVGVDVAYVGADVAARAGDTTLIDGAPVLVVEILSPSDVLEDIHEKIAEYLAAGVRVVWAIDPHDRTVRVYRPGARPVMVNDAEELAAEQELPGFRVPVAGLFP
jgi:Uma2 family endonuclease